MADVKELFPILDDGNLVGTSPDKAIDATTAAAALKGMVGFAFKDSSGNVILPQLTATGKLPVDTEATGGTCKQAKGELAAGSLSAAAITGAEITITAGKIAQDIQFIVSSLQTSLFQIVYVNDAGGTPVETVLTECLVGPGQFTFAWSGKCLEKDTTGGTGIQKIIVKGQNLHKASSMRATLSVVESL